ncbi:hypothetical protein L228DRAFT_103706 [Xylona heveae TC161]|uniref:Uncharacterized protein n=1 Tax=Xylona heveae (strain CBS 132557 / TC161) TaxID=1328760 RepID=A0A161TQV1_XYLHT|nr:hypothetical protein L228DRAFT_103706 [Xylona heveae TC161]KZF24756.1 hypothetical protein L228DRAFT_103706 [Xylona heveae TC161]
MHYIRFLKPPKLSFATGRKASISAVVTVTSDLGESFFAGELNLVSSALSGDKIIAQKDCNWNPGARALKIELDVGHVKFSWPIRIHVGLDRERLVDIFNEPEKSSSGNSLPTVISAWSSRLDPQNPDAAKKVERRVHLLSGPVVGIWEETGESIARHIWDAGVALTSYFDRIVSLQDPGLPQLNKLITESLAGRRKINVIELGSGCGVVGIGLAHVLSNCEVLLTDLPEAEEIMTTNLSCLSPKVHSRVSFKVLDWEENLPSPCTTKRFDLILVADCTYNPDSTPALVKTLSALVAASPSAVIVVAMKVRHQSEAIFFTLMESAGFAQSGHYAIPLPREASLDDYEEEELEKADLFTFQSRGMIS